VSGSGWIRGRLRLAIAGKHLIRARYDGRARITEPHDYGVLNGTEKVLVYQLRHASGSGTSAPGWRLLEVAKIEELVVLEDTFRGSRGRSHAHHF
jgi:hypothetical protein